MPRLQQLKQSFYDRNTITVAKDLLGKLLCRNVNGTVLAGRIVETEAYLADDPACHAYANAQRQKIGLAPTGRSLLLFGEPGCAYVYLNYGMYWLFNVVTESHGTAGAVLIRGVEPVAGVETMRRNRPNVKKDHELSNGPGKLTLALGIGPEFNGHTLYSSKELFIASDEYSIKKNQIAASTRIGITKGKEDLWRFYLKDNLYVSKHPAL